MGNVDRRRASILTGLAALLVIGGLVLAVTAPAGPKHSAKADAYGGPPPVKPTNPKSVDACNKFYGTGQLAEARTCRAIAAYNIAYRKCAKKLRSQRAACRRAAKRKLTAAKARFARQGKAEQVCSSKQRAAYNAIDFEAPGADAKAEAVNEQFQACMKAAQAAK